jgi:hypothetical protein
MSNPQSEKKTISGEEDTMIFHSGKEFEFFIKERKCYLKIFIPDLKNIYGDFKKYIKKIPGKYVENADYYILQSGNKSLVLEREVVLDILPPYPVNDEHMVNKIRGKIPSHSMVEEVIMKNSFVIFRIPKKSVSEMDTEDEQAFFKALKSFNPQNYMAVYVVADSDYVRINPYRVFMEITQRSEKISLKPDKIVRTYRKQKNICYENYYYLDLTGSVIKFDLICPEDMELVIYLEKPSSQLIEGLGKIAEGLGYSLTVITPDSISSELANVIHPETLEGEDD